MKVVNHIKIIEQNDSIWKVILSLRLQYLDHFSQLLKKAGKRETKSMKSEGHFNILMLQVILELSQSRDLILKQTKYFYFRLSEGKQN